jgi:hypothetical protein
MWTCPKCGEEVDEEFDICWQCGTSPEGVEDPSFVHADASVPIEDLRDRLEQKLEHAAALDADFAGVPPVDLVECYWARDELEAKFVVDRLIEQGIPAVSDAGKLHHGLSPAAFGVPYFSPRVRVRAEDLTRARAWLASYEEQRKTRQPSFD